MNVHEVARAASADLRAHTVADVDAGLDALLVAHSRHRRHSRVAVALVAAAAVAVAWWGASGLGGHQTGPEPAPSPPSTSRPLIVPQGVAVCAKALVTCRGNRTYVFALHSPVTWQIPPGYAVDSGAGATRFMVESYAKDSSSGVTVMEGVRAASQGSGPAAGVPATAAGFLNWLAGRPYLHSSTVRHTTLGGLDAWHVRVSLRPHVGKGSGLCNDIYPCYQVTHQDGAMTGIWADMTADYTATDLPGSGTAVVWSWAFGHDKAALHRNEQAVAGLTWPTR